MKYSEINSKTQTKESQEGISPATALEMLKEGNIRFIQNKTVSRNDTSMVGETSTGQFPFAAVLGCIDSRVPAEKVFDQGIGDIFNVRIAGNIVNQDILGSLEFACKVAGSKLVFVLGHKGCGAVRGACSKVEMGNLTGLLGRIDGAISKVDSGIQDRSGDNPAFVQLVAEENVHQSIITIRKESPILREMEEKGEIVIAGGMYDIATGQVDFYS